MSRARPYLADGLDYQGRHPEMACWDSTEDDGEPRSGLVDFFVACILAAAMAVMEEPAKRDTAPPPYPWKPLAAGLVVMFLAIGGASVIAALLPAETLIAAR